MGSTIDGLVSGLNTTQIIAQLMQVERLPEQALTQGRSAASNLASVLQNLNGLVASMQTAATAFAPDSVLTPSAWATTTATSSNTALATAVTSSTATPGSATFTVNQVAAAGSAVSSGSVGSTSTLVATANSSIVVSKGASALGLTAFDGSGWNASSHSIAVTQASSGPTLTGSALSSTITITSGSNDQLSYAIDGVARTVTLAAGSYTPGQLATAVQSATGGDMRAVINGNGALTLTSAHEGSASTFSVTGGSAVAALGMTAPATTAGQDALVSVDKGAAVAITDIAAGQAFSVKAANGDVITSTFTGGLRAGLATATSVATGTGSLADVVAGINAAGAGVQATAVGVSSTAYKLQLTSTTTGAASDVTLSSGAFSTASGLGAMTQLTAGQDTVLHVGTGAGAYDVTSSTNAVSSLLPGVTITALKADPNTSVTVNVASNSSGMADKMQALVDSANAVLSFINRNSAYDPSSKTAQPFLGNSMTSQLAQKIAGAVIGTSTSTPAMFGVSVQKDGTLAFDRTAFLNAYAANPSGVQSTMTTMAQSISDQAKQASDPLDGYITAQITSEQGIAKDYTDQIAAFEDRMTLKQQSLQQQYAALETSLGQLQSQSQWLSGQLGSLMTTSTSSK
ncbi:flagellar filament capping protein FliD [Oryzihumus sp.]|uniref:flagellar filament capping protein FliD n=1 Tax=Oryzihumus sp. TaxID=1968903 RepID=UPI002ED87093